MQPAVNFTSHLLAIPNRPLHCNRLNTNVSFYDYTDVFIDKTPVRNFIKLGEQALVDQKTTGGFNANSPVPEGRFRIINNHLELFVEALTSPYESLSFNDVSAIFECMDSYVSIWRDRTGVGGAKFELSPSGFQTPFARGLFASLWLS